MLPKPPILLATLFSAVADASFAAASAALLAACPAIDPAVGVFDGGSGASDAAGSGLPSVVEPMRITCDTGTPFSFCISFAISDMPVNISGCACSVDGDIMDLIGALEIVPIFAPSLC